jgi:hypothetical protein
MVVQRAIRALNFTGKRESNTEKKKKKKKKTHKGGGDSFRFLSHASIPKDIL